VARGHPRPLAIANSCKSFSSLPSLSLITITYKKIVIVLIKSVCETINLCERNFTKKAIYQ
jgi:hypothetical protein